MSPRTESGASLTLYELGDEIQALLDEVVSQDGEITPEQEARLAALEGDFQAKAEKIALYYRNLRVLAEAGRAEAERVAHLAAAKARAADRLKGYLHREMQRLEMTRVETARVRIRRQRNSQPSVILEVAPDELPVRYQRLTVEPNRALLLESWREGRELPSGVRVEVGEHLRIE